MGKTLVDNISLVSDKDLIETLIAEVDELKQILENDKSFVLGGGEDLAKPLARGRIEGTYLEIQDFIGIRGNLRSIKHLQVFFSKSKDELYPNLKKLLREINIYPFIQDRLDQVFNRQGQIRDLSLIHI